MLQYEKVFHIKQGIYFGAICSIYILLKYPATIRG